MNFFEEFLLAVSRDPLKAFAALYWHLTRRRVRARNRLRQITMSTPYPYQIWIREVEKFELGEAEKAFKSRVSNWPSRPLFSIIVPAASWMGAHAPQRIVDALGQQYYDRFEILLIGEKDGIAFPTPKDLCVRRIAVKEATDLNILEAGATAASGSFVIPLFTPVQLSAAALFRLAEAFEAAPDGEIFYADHDMVDQGGKRAEPWFKPQWNPEMFLSQDFLSALCALRTETVRSFIPIPGDFAGAALFGLLLQATAGCEGRIVHVPHFLAHQFSQGGYPEESARLKALTHYLGPMDARAHAADFDLLRVEWPLPVELPLISIIIPTRDKVDLLRNCIGSVLNITSYPNFEILIVDNDSSDPETIRYFDEIRNKYVRIVRHVGEFNFSSIINSAVQQALGEYVCLLNNDTEVITPDWLTEMMRYACRENIGAVGAKLLYPDGSIQHAGVVIGLGGAAGHAHRYLAPGAPGYFGRPHVAHFVSAVTAACLLINKRKYTEVGGLDESDFRVAFNDVDLCLKLEKAGWRNAYVPQAVLTHHESKSRGNDLMPKNLSRYMRELATLQARWNTVNYLDPLHHPRLDRSNENYVIRL